MFLQHNLDYMMNTNEFRASKITIERNILTVLSSRNFFHGKCEIETNDTENKRITAPEIFPWWKDEEVKFIEILALDLSELFKESIPQVLERL